MNAHALAIDVCAGAAASILPRAASEIYLL